ncbi:Uncharacterized protein APZ42_013737 [Daphnia magna]|uniref:Uncharacterized protein n=1 Tax=Daphnia magna TaxID=35525 RepID=A0A162QJL4_9CRUS|nr:Uncharacterized protein APZ42_013737 [Daphnia magna]
MWRLIPNLELNQINEVFRLVRKLTIQQRIIHPQNVYGSMVISSS